MSLEIELCPRYDIDVSELSPFWTTIRKPVNDSVVKIGFTDSTDSRILKAAVELRQYPHIKPIFIGDSKKIIEACKLMDINFIDHLIVTEHGYTSFADNQII